MGDIVTMGDRDMGAGRVVAGELPAVVHSGVEKAIGYQQSAVSRYVQRLRGSRPDATPAQIVSTLERRYLAAVTGVGAAVGAAAAVPGAGTGLALALSAGETAVFAETTTMFTLAVAEVHAIRVGGLEHRQTPVFTVALSTGGAMRVDQVSAEGIDYWGKLLTDLIPMSSISAINKVLWHWFVTQYPRRRGLMAIGKIAPFGIGAGLAAVGNLAFGRMVVSANRRVFGPPPANFVDGVRTIVDSQREASPRPAVAPAPPQPDPAQPDFTQPDPAAAPVTGKYRPLFDHLASVRTDRVDIGFSDIDALVPGGLPKSASTKSWWGNSPGSRQAKAWLAAGYAAEGVDLERRTVRFKKRRQR
ncbi:MAG: DUF7662 domain-containing protein [Pseudonocardiales bacterium]